MDFSKRGEEKPAKGKGAGSKGQKKETKGEGSKGVGPGPDGFFVSHTRRIQICPKKGISLIILFWGWD